MMLWAVRVNRRRGPEMGRKAQPFHRGERGPVGLRLVSTVGMMQIRWTRSSGCPGLMEELVFQNGCTGKSQKV